MKKFAAISLLCASLLSSCSFLEVPLESSVSTSNYYQQVSDFSMSLTGVYNILISASWSDDARYGTYFQGFLLTGRVGTDEMLVAFDNGKGEAALGDYSYTPTNLYVSRPWYMMYKGIQRANTIIDRLTAFETDHNDEKNKILGESYFLRAFFYFHLVRLYGQVPISAHEITDVEKMDLTKRSEKEVYELIVGDLQTAESLLPETNALGHAYRDAAKAMLGKVYLQMSGYPLKDSSAAALAKAKLAEVIGSGKYALVEDYLSLFDASNEYSSEYIWDIEFSNNGTTTYGGCVGTVEGPTNPASLYWTMLRVPREFYETFDQKDKRIESIARYGLAYDEDGNIVPEYFWEGAGYASYDDYKTDLAKYIAQGVYTEDPDWYYFAYKFRHALTAEERGTGWANWANPINFPVIRYSDVLLMYAEADLRANGSISAEALEYVNQVRRRGYGKDILTPDKSCDLKDMTLDDMLAERSFELCFEGHRWYDLVRFEKLEEGVKKLSTYSLTKNYTNQAINFQAKHWYYPVPQDVIDSSEGAIEQNELWR